MPLPHVSTLSGRSATYPAGFPLPFGCWRSLLGASLPRRRVGPPLRSAYWPGQTETGLSRSAPGRDDGGGCPLYSGVGVSAQGLLRFPCPQRPGIAVLINHRPATLHDEASSRVHSHSPVPSFPRPVCPDGSDAPWPLPLASYPTVASDARRDREPAWTLAGVSRPLTWSGLVSHSGIGRCLTALSPPQNRAGQFPGTRLPGWPKGSDLLAGWGWHPR